MDELLTIKRIDSKQHIDNQWKIHNVQPMNVFMDSVIYEDHKWLEKIPVQSQCVKQKLVLSYKTMGKKYLAVLKGNVFLLLVLCCETMQDSLYA